MKKGASLRIFLNTFLTFFLLALYFLYSFRDPVRFAETHIQLSFLNFPIFIGEICLILATVLFAIRIFVDPFPLRKWHILVICFYLFVIAKALYGYGQHGPLAFRNAALFYYSWFAIIGMYTFEIQTLRKSWVKYTLLFLCNILFLMRTLGRNDGIGIDYHYTYFVFALVLSLTIPNRHLKYGSIILTTSLALIGFELGNRGVLLSVMSSLIFLSLIYVFWFFRMHQGYKIILSFILIIFIFLVMGKLADRNALNSFLFIREYISKYQEIQKFVAAYEDLEIPKVDVKLYETAEELQKKYPQPSLAKASFAGTPSVRAANCAKKVEAVKVNITKTSKEVGDKPSISTVISEESVRKEETSPSNLILPSPVKDVTGVAEAAVECEDISGSLEQLIRQRIQVERSLGTAKGNILWRTMVWGDMFTDLRKEKKIIGFDLGYPFRSRSIETLWAVLKQDWSMGHWVGWVEPHNSYIHILYRAGIIGIIFIGFVFAVCLRIIKGFLSQRSVAGILSFSAVLYWLVIANFAVILELPYYAIPFWSLLGWVVGYHRTISQT